MRILYFDCFAGASGDMVLGALLDAGLPLDELKQALGSLPLGGLTLAAERVERGGIAATRFRVSEGTQSPDDQIARSPNQEIATSHHHHHHRSLSDIEALVERSALSSAVKTRVGQLFRRLAETEAAIHRMPVERVHLHEVGALDSIVDIVGAVFAIEWFQADRIVASPLNVGGGTVECEHGTLPVPAPATVSLTRGAPIYSAGAQVELLTPTGALLMTSFASSFGPVPAMTVERVGYGAGDRHLSGMPNVLRVLVGQGSGTAATESVVVLECEIDDMNPQIYGVLMDRLFDAGALDVFYAPVQMKKNRPGTLVTAVAPPAARTVLRDVLFRETTTIGVRYRDMMRETLPREVVTVETTLGPIRFKIARQGSAIVNAAPEFEDCVRVAAECGLSVKDVQAAAVHAYVNTRSSPGP